MMKNISIAVFLALTTTAGAADMAKPVQAIMDLAASRSSPSYEGDADYFDNAHIGNFSAELRALYAEASKHPAYDAEEEIGSPFDYDPIIMGNGGSCNLEDLAIEVGGKDGSATDVIARSKDRTCVEDSTEEERNTVTVRHFRVILEDGKPVIDDFDAGEGEDHFSLKETLKVIIED